MLSIRDAHTRCVAQGSQGLIAAHLIAGVVGNGGRAVEQVADAMAAVGLDNLEAVPAGMRADDVPDVPIPRAGPHRRYGLVQRLLGTCIGVTPGRGAHAIGSHSSFTQAARASDVTRMRRFEASSTLPTTYVSFRSPVVALQKDSDVYVYNIAVL